MSTVIETSKKKWRKGKKGIEAQLFRYKTNKS